jgi:hypothetical protein
MGPGRVMWWGSPSVGAKSFMRGVAVLPQEGDEALVL